jgi:hypothetical protein
MAHLDVAALQPAGLGALAQWGATPEGSSRVVTRIMVAYPGRTFYVYSCGTAGSADRARLNGFLASPVLSLMSDSTDQCWKLPA